MSNHSVGHSINDYFTGDVLQMYDNQELSYENVLSLFKKVRSIINCEDGNYEEAIECIRKCRCGKCLKKMEKGEPLYSLYSIRFCCSEKMKNNLWEIEEENLVSDNLCTNCFDEIVCEYEQNEKAGESYRKYIEEHEDKKYWTAE